jgi:integrase
MSAASDVTSDPDAQRPGADGAAIADAMTQERAPLATHEYGSDRDRNAIDDADHRERNRDAVEAQLDEPRNAVTSDAPPLPSKEQGLEIIRQARQLVKMARLISPGSVENYTRKSDRMLAEFDELGGDDGARWAIVLKPFVPKANSFFAMRAAAAWRIREKLRALLATLQARIRMALGNVADVEWRKTLMQIERHTACLRALEAIDRSNLLRSSGSESSKVESKRADLCRFKTDWRDEMVEASEHDTYGEAVWVLAVTGCRPQELVNGVELRPEFDRITVKIKGAKVSASSGQPWRELDVSWRSVTVSLEERLAGRESLTMRIFSTAGLRKAVAAVGRRLWPKGKRVCPYHFRHQLAEDMRESGRTADEIAAALGQRVGETASHYGRRSRKGQGGVAREPDVIRGAVRTAKPVRSAAPFDPASVTKKSGRKPRANMS